MLACAHPVFDGPVILFQDVIERVFEKSHAGAIRFSIGRIEARTTSIGCKPQRR